MSKFLPTSRVKWIDPKEFDLNKYNSNCSKGCVPDAGLKNTQELQELLNDYALALDKIEIKREMLSDLYNISTCNVKKLLPNLLVK